MHQTPSTNHPAVSGGRAAQVATYATRRAKTAAGSTGDLRADWVSEARSPPAPPSNSKTAPASRRRRSTGIGAGVALAGLARRLGYHELTDNHRQIADWERHVLADLQVSGYIHEARSEGFEPPTF